VEDFYGSCPPATAAFLRVNRRREKEIHGILSKILSSQVSVGDATRTDSILTSHATAHSDSQLTQSLSQQLAGELVGCGVFSALARPLLE
jgi:hypothetical protein